MGIERWSELWEGEAQSTVIKVVGVGGAGGNAVEHMIREGCRGIDYICCNTDALALTRSSAPVKLQLGSGLGAGGNTGIARELASAGALAYRRGLGGCAYGFHHSRFGWWYGYRSSAPVVAEVARELGILTVAVVTKPIRL
jgi:cell division protein FtsZ